MVFTVLYYKDITSRELFTNMKVSKKKLIIIQCIVFLNLALFQCSFCDQKGKFYPRNIELLSSLVDRVAREAVKCLELSEGDTVCIGHDEEDSKVERFVLDRFYRILLESGVQIFYSCDTSRNGLGLSLHVWDAGVKYHKYVGRTLFKQGKVQRMAELKLSLRALHSSTGQFVYMGDLTDHIEDQVPVVHLGDVEEGSIVIGKPSLPDEEKLRRWFEPIVVLGVMGAVTCLFYLIRSS